MAEQITALFSLMNLLMNDASKSPRSRGKKIALIYAVGLIVNGESKLSLLGGQIVGADTVIKSLKKAEQDDEVKAIVLRVDSSGVCKGVHQSFQRRR